LTGIFVLASLALLPTGAVVGADHNHLLVPGLALCVGAGALIARLLRAFFTGDAPGTRARWALPAVGALLAVYLVFTSAPSSAYNVNLEVPTADYREQMRKIIDNVSRHPGQLFFSDTVGVLALAGKETGYDDPFTMNILAQQGRWDQSGLRDKLSQGKFALLVLSCDVINTSKTCQFSPDMVQAIRDGYEVLFKDVLFTYAPRQ
ncbi:MAG TPA: hypothetical protein VM409_03255, partial [Chloroflexia bacterium]|nr:hypothetical protein [Chloroflexia bacterium]